MEPSKQQQQMMRMIILLESVHAHSSSFLYDLKMAFKRKYSEFDSYVAKTLKLLKNNTPAEFNEQLLDLSMLYLEVLTMVEKSPDMRKSLALLEAFNNNLKIEIDGTDINTYFKKD